MSAASTQFVESFDGTRLAVHRLSPEEGEGRPVLLLHGLFSDAAMNWQKFGHAAELAGAGFEAIMPDLRAHGESAAPHGADAYPGDVLARDLLVLVEALDIDDFDLVGFSLGARTAVRGVLAGLTPRRLVLAGMGLSGLTGWDRRAAFFIDAIDRFDQIQRGDPAFMAKSFMKSQGVDRVAARLLLQSVADTDEAELSAVTMPTLVLCGTEDADNGSPTDLAAALPDAVYEAIPGTHMSSVTKPEMGREIARFLAA